jgi:D-hydroxyproline dehydrogenase subunit gamma
MLDVLSVSQSTVTVTICGEQVEVPAEISAAAAFLLHSQDIYIRTSQVTGERRAPLCMMGVCFECLLEINNVSQVQGCLVRVEEGMQINRQSGVKAL